MGSTLMYMFTRNPQPRKLWAVKIKRMNFMPTDNLCLCEKHFTDDQSHTTGEGGEDAFPRQRFARGRITWDLV